MAHGIQFSRPAEDTSGFFCDAGDAGDAGGRILDILKMTPSVRNGRLERQSATSHRGELTCRNAAPGFTCRKGAVRDSPISVNRLNPPPPFPPD